MTILCYVTKEKEKLNKTPVSRPTHCRGLLSRGGISNIELVRSTISCLFSFYVAIS